MCDALQTTNCRLRWCMVLVLAVLLQTISAGSEDEHSPLPVISSPPVVHTTNGSIKGRIVCAGNGRYAQEFLNIPFAQPPVGELRFQAPKPVAGKWEGVRDGTKVGNACVQNTGFLQTLTFRWALFSLVPETKHISEDCLNLNIYMPYRPAESHSSEPGLPILFYIHGGAFKMSGNTVPLHNAGILATEINAIVVMPNYRLGALGFLALKGVEGVNGNQGLMDQALALKWVHDNAISFGGDPNRITLAGVSAGSASVHYHLLSHVSRKLFARSIMQSGTAMPFWAYQPLDELQKSSEAFAVSADCNADTSDSRHNDDLALYKCLLGKTTQEMIAAAVKLRLTSDKHIILSPTVDGKFMTKSPAEHLRDGDFHRGPTIIGTTANESMPLLAMFNVWTVVPQLPNVRLTPAKFDEILNMGQVITSKVVRDALKFVYRNWSAPEEGDAGGAERWRMINSICDDYMFSNGLIETLDAYRNYSHKQVYRYRFNHVPTKSLWGYQYDASAHGDDVLFFLGHLLDARFGFSSGEVTLCRRIMHDFGNFVHTGNPNKLPFSSAEQKLSNSPAAADESWPPYAGNHEYYTFDEKNYGEIGVGPERWRIEFWHQALPYLIQLEKNAGAKEARETAEHKLLMAETLEEGLVHKRPPESSSPPSFLTKCFLPIRSFCASCLQRFLLFVLTYP